MENKRDIYQYGGRDYVLVQSDLLKKDILKRTHTGLYKALEQVPDPEDYKIDYQILYNGEKTYERRTGEKGTGKAYIRREAYQILCWYFKLNTKRYCGLYTEDVYKRLR